MNQGHRDFQSLALPTELLRHIILNYKIKSISSSCLRSFQMPVRLLYLLNIFNQVFFLKFIILFSNNNKKEGLKPSSLHYSTYLSPCGANQAVTFLPSTIGFFSTVTGSFSKSPINLFAKSTANDECCISRPLNITTILTLLP